MQLQGSCVRGACRVWKRDPSTDTVGQPQSRSKCTQFPLQSKVSHTRTRAELCPVSLYCSRPVISGIQVPWSSRECRRAGQHRGSTSWPPLPGAQNSIGRRMSGLGPSPSHPLKGRALGKSERSPEQPCHVSTQPRGPGGVCGFCTSRMCRVPQAGN